MKTSMLLVATQMHNPAFNQELKSKDKKEEKEKRIKKKVGNCGWKNHLISSNVYAQKADESTVCMFNCKKFPNIL